MHAQTAHHPECNPKTSHSLAYGHDSSCLTFKTVAVPLSATPTRWKLRAAIRAVNQVMARLRVAQHPDKTIIGRVARGFDFLGYRFSAAGLAIARQTVERCAEHVSRLYEHGGTCA